MRNLMIITCLVFSISVVGFSQVKEKYRDTSNTSTIIVVKDDASIDEDVLNEFFDLASMNMNDQIMITTSAEAPDMSTASASIEQDMEQYFEQEIKIEEVVNEAPKNIAREKVILANDNDVDDSPKVVQSAVKISPKRAKGYYPTKSSYEVKKAAKKKYFNKKNHKRKNKKRKNRKRGKKRKDGSCYSF